ncbi:MAG: MBL fold metallo-hydrolase [Clostridia bacterium]|nr:MBL fold metallo-hydrolase [Clostridia bacterium]
MAQDIPAFRIAGNLYFVGTYEASSHLIDTGDGLILIDTGYERTADVVVKGIAELGFDVKDVKIILHSHGHYDHTDGTPKVVALCGAKTYLGEADLRYLRGRFVPDVWLHDGDVIRLGNTEILCLATPGHTEGTFSFFWNLTENGKTYRAGTFGGAGTKQLTKDFLNERDLSWRQRGHFFESIERLKGEHVDIFIGNHAWQNDTPGNYEKSLTSDTNPFIDDSRWLPFLEECKQKLLRVIQEESSTHFVNYAHRGASEYNPENTMMSFYAGMAMGANGIETDVQLTKDGVPVLFHDDTLVRVTGEEGGIPDYTLDELMRFRVKKGELYDRIVTLEDFLAHFAYRPITFAIELKNPAAAHQTADMVRKFGIQAKSVITSFNFGALQTVRAYAPELHTGYLVVKVTDEVIAKMEAEGIEELCPKAVEVTPERVAEWHGMGYNVRAWGVSNTDLMRSVCEAGADGMTINFPDKLTEYLKKNEN